MSCSAFAWFAYTPQSFLDELAGTTEAFCDQTGVGLTTILSGGVDPRHSHRSACVSAHLAALLGCMTQVLFARDPNQINIC